MAGFAIDRVFVVLHGVRLLPQTGARPLSWAELVERKREQWPIQYLLPGGAYIR